MSDDFRKDIGFIWCSDPSVLGTSDLLAAEAGDGSEPRCCGGYGNDAGPYCECGPEDDPEAIREATGCPEGAQTTCKRYSVDMIYRFETIECAP